MKKKFVTLPCISAPNPEAFETLALAEHHTYIHPGNIPIPSEENILAAKKWVDDNAK